MDKPTAPTALSNRWTMKRSMPGKKSNSNQAALLAGEDLVKRLHLALCQSNTFIQNSTSKIPSTWKFGSSLVDKSQFFSMGWCDSNIQEPCIFWEQFTFRAKHLHCFNPLGFMASGHQISGLIDLRVLRPDLFGICFLDEGQTKMYQFVMPGLQGKNKVQLSRGQTIAGYEWF